MSAANGIRGGVKVCQLRHCLSGETSTPPRRFASTLPLQGRVANAASRFLILCYPM
jgi:hypothetical protein